MRAVLGRFALTCVEDRFGADLAGCLDDAIGHYREQATTRLAMTPPREAPGAPAGSRSVETEVALKPANAAFVEAEAERLEVEPARLLNHILLLYLADQDRRAGRRMCDGRKHGRPPLPGS